MNLKRVAKGVGRMALLLSVVSSMACRDDAVRSSGESAKPPEAPRELKELVQHGHVRMDPYYWLNERENPEVLTYLEAENQYLESVLGHTASLQEDLYKEMRDRVKEDDTSVPYELNGYWYYTRYEEDLEYPVHCRRKGSMEAPEEILVDVNEVAEGHEFVSVTTLAVSEDSTRLAYSVDTTGRRIYTTYFKDLETGELFADHLEEVTGNLVWAHDGETVYFTKQDPQTLRSHRVLRHRLGSTQGPEVVYEEVDSTFSVYLSKTKSRKYLLMTSVHTEMSEVRVLDATDPQAEWQTFLPRSAAHEYYIEHVGESFLIRTNREAPNFKLMSTSEQGDWQSWREEIAHREDVYLADFEVFEDFLVLSERKDGLLQIRVRPNDGSAEHYLDFGEPAYSAYIAYNPQFATSTLRYFYSSLTTPSSVFDYDLSERTRELLKVEEVLGGFSKDDYVTERLHATAVDGERVPISLVYRKGVERNGDNPLLLYAYGSYGASMDASFRSTRLSLLDRGFVFAIAHVRGGQELGRRWYEDGRLFNKKNTFTDFVAVAEELVAQDLTRPERLYAQGGSAGGLLIGAVVNLRPDLFRGAIADVPFVDVITTMLDPSIPLTTGEWEEWGDPKNEDEYHYLLSYSPYDNVEAKDYPALLVTTGLHDSQVQYWEPAKWVAKLRSLKTDDNLLVLRTNMEAGHGGASGRFERLREVALEIAFLLEVDGAT